MIKKFIRLNQNICNKIELLLPHTKPDITELYSFIISEYANKQKNLTIIDIGGGRLTPFAKLLNSKNKHKIIIIDENKIESGKNRQADKIIIADVNKNIPLKNNSADMIVSRYTFEHLNNLPAFLSNSKKILKKEGLSIHLFSCKFAPFAILNQLFPKKISQTLLRNFIPESHVHGFKTDYNYCYYDAVTSLFSKNGFKIKNTYISYYQSRYFSFFLPFFIMSIIYEFIISSLRVKNLCAYILIVAVKNGD